MSTAAETKICPHCAETIKAAARLCPFCRSRQSRWAFRSYEIVVALTGLVLVVFATVLFVSLAPSDEGKAGRAFAGHRGDLVVLEPRLIPAASSATCWLTGYVTNRGAYPWRVEELETRLMDSHSAMIDARHSRVDDPFVVLPGGAHAFRLKWGERDVAGEALPQVRVQMATDGNLPPRPK
jgi:hypothetical protein